MWLWQKREIYGVGTEQNPQIDAHLQSQLISVEGTRSCNGETVVFSTSGAGMLGNHMFTRTNLNQYLTSCAKLNLRWMLDLNVKAKTIKL